MVKLIAANDPLLTWKGVISLQRSKEFTMPWRIPYDKVDLFAWTLAEKAAMPAGVRIEFRTDSDWVELITTPEAERSAVDIFCDGIFKSTMPTINKDHIKFADLGEYNKEIQIWLPQQGEFRLKGIEISDTSSISKSNINQNPKWITYGSSITQCRDADSPSLTWPSIVARSNNLDLTCLGYGGECHLDPLVAKAIRDSDADLISLCLGINIYAYSSLNQRTFQPGIWAFIELIREKHAEVPMIVMSPIYASRDKAETTDNDVGFTLQKMRREIEESVEVLKRLGDKNIHYINGLDIFHERNKNLLHDGVHPDNRGYALMAENISKLLKPHISNL